MGEVLGYFLLERPDYTRAGENVNSPFIIRIITTVVVIVGSPNRQSIAIKSH